jgi:fatty-acyl-CoA synthase
VYDERWGEAGLLAVVLEEGATLTLADVHRYAVGRLARFKYPAHLMVVDALPRSATDKVARPALRKLFEAAGTESGESQR